jgi:hypothetical protein
VPKPGQPDGFFHQLAGMLPRDLRQTRLDFERNLKAAVGAALARMDLVTREEFDIQVELLGKTRAMLEELERKVADLEAGRQRDGE